tara:strand:+ start:230 stop:1258 length:1029 start_codon:yes stop_codon:yes gene_type:complete
MSLKNLNATTKTHRFLFNKLKDKKIYNIYNIFENEVNLKNNFIVAVSGGPDSLALSFLAKIYSIKNSLKVKYIIIDHRLREGSTDEANFVKKLLKKIDCKLSVIAWNGKKPKVNIQSAARAKRYNFLIKEAKKQKIKNILLGHQLDDLYENFFIRMLRGSGLNGMVSLDRNVNYQKINLIRPLLNFSKKDLEYISKKVFKTFVNDPSNKNNKFRRVKIRNFIQNLQFEGLDYKKFSLTLKNLKFANETINFFIKKNLYDNSTIDKNKKSVLLNEEFVNQPEEIVFRSFTEIIRKVGNKYYPVRGKKLDKIINQLKNPDFYKATLGNCVIRKVNKTIIVEKEH